MLQRQCWMFCFSVRRETEPERHSGKAKERERESTLTVAWFNPSKINKTLSLKPCNQSIEIQQCTTQKLEEINNILTI